MERKTNMKRYNIVWIIIVLIASFLLSGCTNSQFEKDPQNDMIQGTVYVNWNVTEIPGYIGSSEVRLPFMQIVRSLGMVIEQKNNRIFQITYKSDVFILQCYPYIFLASEERIDDNFMIPVPGASSFYCQYESGDVFLDDETLTGAISLMGLTVHLYTDYVNSEIFITTPYK